MTLYRGLPYDLPLGIELYSEVYSIPVQAGSVPEDRRDSLTDHDLRSRDDAVTLLDDLEADAVAPTAAGAGAGTGGQAAGGQPRAAAKGGGARLQRRPGGWRRDVRRRAGRRRQRQLSARNRELLALVPVAVLVAAGFAAVFIVNDNEVSDVSLTYGGYFLALCLAAHVFLRIRLPYADPYLFPLCALLAAIGLVVIYRIDDELAFDQASVFVLGLVLFCLTILFLRDYHVLERYRYLIAIAGILLLLAPFITRNPVNGAYLSVDIGPISFQPAELAKICIVIFLASYLAEKREMLSVAARRVLGLTIPPLKHFGPLLVVWGAAMLMLVFIRDLGSSLMFFGAFLALLYVATNRFSYVLIGLVIFAVGAYAIGSSISHVHDRFEIWLDPFAGERARRRRPGAAVAVRAGRRRPLRAGARRVAAEAAGPVRAQLRAAVPRVRQHPPGPAHRLHLRGDHDGARPVRRLRA